MSHVFQKKLAVAQLRPKDLFIIGRDQAYFKLLFFSADRGGDLGQMKTQEILRFPDNSGLLFNHVWGKTLRDGTSNVFGVHRHPTITICPVRAIENYIAMVHELGLDLSTGFLFRPTDHKGLVINTAFASSTAESRLRSYLNEGKINDGETLHSFRSGCAIPLALSGSSLIDVMSQVGWHRASTAHYYMKLAQVLRCDGPSSYLAATDPSQSSSADQYIDMNTLKQFLCAFPPTHTS